MDKSLKIAVLYGGNSAEREVSLMSGHGVGNALKSRGYNIELFDIANRDLLELKNFDLAFIALHGKYGEDGCIQGFLELLKIPYTGPGVMSSSVGMNKIVSKKIFIHEGIPTPEFRVVRDYEGLQKATQEIGYPIIVKPPQEGSTIGLKKVHSQDELTEAFNESIKFDEEMLVEKCIEGRELTVAILGKSPDTRALPIIEIVTPDGNYDYEQKYTRDDTQYICPAKLDENLARNIENICIKAYDSLECQGWSRVDVMLDKNNCPWVLEINTSPGMTSHSLVPMAAKAIGLSYEDICEEILKTASLKVKKLNKV
ncbi:D-alanine--D-alanine ligase [Taylorella equigenitalis]|uniref:D-alanine--D-alanine ligase n=1 Tax=Taylorella equigenitalis ATCC 35865 TaxID=743973 RepID=A0ABM5NBL1_9BURK|nr:D-alanine--D-alanine ligase [Taylorella equigenitalis]AFN36350.1 D-alanine--D-alanine ligase [Taylorella equigenitalis ATCC 35865]ASY39753.1 D-alanine--D-alanine ligase [Taylorella equigenitalis]VEG32262.1 D-alanine--D-alanine ligase B [Taylorella equigenitalis ATCC 35865]